MKVNEQEFSDYIKNVAVSDKSGLFDQMIQQQFNPESIVILGSYMYVLEKIAGLENLYIQELKDVLNSLEEESEDDTSIESLSDSSENETES